MTSKHVAIQIFISVEIDYRIEVVPGCAECDFMAISKETTCHCADRLWQAAFDAKSKRFAMTALENAIARPRINFGREIDDCRR